jgi:hypothetical protein
VSDETHQLDQLAISASGFVFDPISGATFTVNATGRALLEGLRDGLGLAGLVSRLGDQFEAGDADLSRDVLEFARSLRDAGLLPPTFEVQP